jgi:AGZA family xanthine/uracil permease-like MFS transporter
MVVERRLTDDERASIAYGVIAGIFSYILLNGVPWVIRKATGDRLVPRNYETAERWAVPPGGLIPIWM